MCMFCISPEVTLYGWRPNWTALNRTVTVDRRLRPYLHASSNTEGTNFWIMFYVHVMCMFCISPEVTLCGWRPNWTALNRTASNCRLSTTGRLRPYLQASSNTEGTNFWIMIVCFNLYVHVMCVFYISPEVTLCGWRGYKYKPSINKRASEALIPCRSFVPTPPSPIGNNSQGSFRVAVLPPEVHRRKTHVRSWII